MPQLTAAASRCGISYVPTPGRSNADLETAFYRAVTDTERICATLRDLRAGYDPIEGPSPDQLEADGNLEAEIVSAWARHYGAPIDGDILIT
ncbi:MAG TPA: hypothetical protein VGS58_12975 [Candidatus Sulfopaludibacter sp.]|nr:hypothetical protein [Candidatus Sulfopaludibacter sp.]